jgi:hypothetical protein
MLIILLFAQVTTASDTLLVITNYTWTFFYETSGKKLDLVQTVAMPDIEWEAKIERISRIKFSSKFLVSSKIFLI